MKWTRTEDPYREYSTLSIGTLDYISVVRTKETNLFQFVYSKNGDVAVTGSIIANSWDDTEMAIVETVQYKLRHKAEYWNELLANFNEKVNANEL